MHNPLSPEIIDLILNFVPYSDYLYDDHPSQTLLACTTVSRSFNIAARGRIFSILPIAQASTLKKTQANLKSLATLLETHPDILQVTHTVKITVAHGSSKRWAYLNDTALSRMLCIVLARQRKLGLLEIDCFLCPEFEAAFGRRTKQAIRELIPSVQSLSFSNFDFPAALLEKLPTLKFLHLKNVKLVPQTNKSYVLPQIFPSHLDISVDTRSLGEIDLLCSQSQQSLPVYTSVRLNISWNSFAQFNNIRVHEYLESSTHALRTLALHISECSTANSYHIEFGQFKALSTFRMVYDCGQFLNGLLTVSETFTNCLKSAVKFLSWASFPSNLCEIELEIAISDRSCDSDDESLASMVHIEGLTPKDLLSKHPKLKSFTVTFVPTIENYTGRLTRMPCTLVQRHVEYYFPRSLHIATDSSISLLAYEIPLDG